MKYQAILVFTGDSFELVEVKPVPPKKKRGKVKLPEAA